MILGNLNIFFPIRLLVVLSSSFGEQARQLVKVWIVVIDLIPALMLALLGSSSIYFLPYSPLWP